MILIGKLVRQQCSWLTRRKPPEKIGASKMKKLLIGMIGTILLLTGAFKNVTTTYKKSSI